MRYPTKQVVTSGRLLNSQHLQPPTQTSSSSLSLAERIPRTSRPHLYSGRLALTWDDDSSAIISLWSSGRTLVTSLARPKHWPQCGSALSESTSASGPLLICLRHQELCCVRRPDCTTTLSTPSTHTHLSLSFGAIFNHEGGVKSNFDKCLSALANRKFSRPAPGCMTIGRSFFSPIEPVHHLKIIKSLIRNTRRTFLQLWALPTNNQETKYGDFITHMQTFMMHKCSCS